jgi:hypothetical protein
MTGPEPDERYAIAYAEGLRMISEQSQSLDELRSRVGLLVSAASVATSFLAATALRDASRPLGLGAYVAIAAFAALLIPALAILWPREWTFKNSPTLIIGTNIEEAHQSLDDLRRDLALHLETDYDSNSQKIRWLLRLYSAAIALLVVEIIGWLAELGAADALIRWLQTIF